MISLTRQHRLTKKMVIIVIAGFFGAVVMAVGIWWAVAESAMGQYRQSLSSYKSSTTDALHSVIEKLKGESDVAKRRAAVADLAKAAAGKASAQPQLPSVLGIGAGSDQDKAKQASLTVRLEQFVSDAEIAQKLLAYQSAVAKSLQELAARTGNNADEQKALAEAWQTAIGELKVLDVPNVAKSNHEKLITAASDIQATLATLPDLYNKKDFNAFAIKQSELQTKTGKLRELADAFGDLAVEQDKVLAASYATLLSRLK